MEILNCQKLKYDWNNDELKYMEELVGKLEKLEFLEEFSGIKLNSDSGGSRVEIITPLSTEQQAYEELVNAGLIRPTNMPPSAVDNIIIIKDDIMTDTTKI